MRLLARTALVLAAISIVGCGRSSPLQPDQVNPARAASSAAQISSQSQNATATVTAMGGKPEIDPTYANGTTVYMIGPHMIVNARATMPNAYEHAEELYLVVYPQLSTPQPGAGPITLPSGYRPQCNPCFHPGLPPDFVYHDHVITGAPGMGNNGTAGEYKAPWKIILLVYNPDYVKSRTFAPLTSAAAIDAAERAGDVFLPVNHAGGNPYEIDTGNLLICPTVSNHA
jgi:hypothetical protein